MAVRAGQDRGGLSLEIPGVSIIVPCHDAGHFLVECVRSIASQAHVRPYEIIVVDDASADTGTRQALEHIEGWTAVTVIRLDENRGAQHARNIGLKAARFAYTFTIDGDDCLNTNKDVLCRGTYVDRSFDILSGSPDTAFTQPLVMMFGEFQGLTISSYPLDEVVVVNKGHVPISICVRRADAIAAGLYDEGIEKWQDWSFGIAILNARHKAGKRNNIAFLDAAYYLYRIHSDSRRTSRKDVSELDMVLRTVQRHPELFRKYYPAHISNLEIARAVVARKPGKLTDLLRVAHQNVDTALGIVRERGFELSATRAPDHVP